jgi:hypothetical protein
MLRLLAILCFFLINLGILSFPDRDARGNLVENFIGLQGKVFIRLSAMSYKQNEPIYLDVSIKNFGNEVIRFFPTNANLKTYQFVITDENDESLPMREELKLEDLKSAKIRTVNLVGDRVKEIIIHKNETFTKRFDLSEYYDLEPGKKYYVTSYFYPNFTEDRDNFIKSSNQAIFQIEKRKIEKQIRKFSESELVTDGLSPEETIFLFLGAELKKNWQNYFKYIHFPEFILGYTKYSNEYNTADENYKNLVIDDFKKYLSESKSGNLTYYKVLSSEVMNPQMARVFVHVEREQKRVVSKFEYQYTLKKTDESLKGFWKIASVVVRVKK